MFKQFLLGVAVLGFASPSFAQSVPNIAVGVSPVASNIVCRNKAISKYFELGAKNMSDVNSNSQWSIISNMRALVWCRDTQAFIAVSGPDNNAVGELRDEILKVF